jgi:hypothetical protein
MHYSMLRLFLTRRETDLLDHIEPVAISTREEHLRDVFQREIRFSYRRKSYVYKPFFVDTDEDRSREYISAVIGREQKATVGAPPEQGFKPKSIPDWETANVFIDPAGDENGQRVAM